MKKPSSSKRSSGCCPTVSEHRHEIKCAIWAIRTLLRSILMGTPPSPEQLRKMDAYWRAANYLAVGQIYLYDNPLLKEPLQRKHVKPRLLGHWGTTPGQNFVYVHLNRINNQYDLSKI